MMATDQNATHFIISSQLEGQADVRDGIEIAFRIDSVATTAVVFDESDDFISSTQS